MIFNLILFLTLGPIIEWGAHKFLHYCESNYHLSHHRRISLNIPEMEMWPLSLLILAYFLNSLSIFMGVMKYWVFHTIIHKKPKLLPSYTKHHMLHHKYKNYNFCVSNTWPDKLFGTYRDH